MRNVTRFVIASAIAVVVIPAAAYYLRQPSNDPLGDNGLQPRRSLRLGRRERRPFHANEIDVDRVAICGQERFDVHLILGAERDHLGEYQPFGGGHSDRVALGPLQ